MVDFRFGAAPAIAGTVAFLVAGVLGAPSTQASDANSPSGSAADGTTDAAAGATGDAGAGATGDAGASAAPSGPGSDSLATVVVTAKRLNEARTEIETQTGASTYTIDSSVIAAAPGGE